MEQEERERRHRYSFRRTGAPLHCLQLPVDAEKFFVDLGFDTVERVYSALSAAPDEWQQNLKDLVNVSELLERIRRDWPQVVIKPVPVAKKDVVQGTGLRIKPDRENQTY